MTVKAKDIDMTGNPDAGRMLNEIRWELQTELGDKLDAVLEKIRVVGLESKDIQPTRVDIMDWIFAVFDKHCGIEDGEDK